MADALPSNLYVHFPFCRRKCTYCVLPSRAGVSQADRDAYVVRLAEKAKAFNAPFKTIYFGGGSPGLCNLDPLFEALGTIQTPKHPNTPNIEFTVELHPLDVTRETLQRLKDGGVNRISMGVQSLDDDILRHMGRGYTFMEAERAFYLIKEYFDNAGIDLIIGYVGESGALTPRHARLSKWGLKHCSVYSLILEDGSILRKQVDRGLSLPDDETTLNRISIVSRFLKDLGLERYEISNYAVPGCECRHNLATWRGEDYLGLGDGACGRVGLTRTRNFGGQSPEVETVTPEQDALERQIFRLRTREGLDATGHPEWIPLLDRFTAEGLLTKESPVYRLTERGTEVCDTILAELV